MLNGVYTLKLARILSYNNLRSYTTTCPQLIHNSLLFAPQLCQNYQAGNHVSSTPAALDLDGVWLGSESSFGDGVSLITETMRIMMRHVTYVLSKDHGANSPTK